ncbi:MAG: indole-3-glycerol phosphate synthase TrpC [Dehalococcoidia bacterium]|nr:indole-3-glycerol phosphate synthase TrpC [Dehalococcoidia bacterium]
MILDDIVARKKQDLVFDIDANPLALLERRIEARRPTIDFEASLIGGGVRLIAEIKRASPSKGLLCPGLEPRSLARTYAANGAASISVLTERYFFQGDLSFLDEARKGVEDSGTSSIPLLRKDFLFDPYQVYEARAGGADAILLIVAILTDHQLRDLLSLAGQLGMQCLVEVHDRNEIERAIAVGSRIIGINNRDLRTFKVDLNTTQDLARSIPPGKLVVAESGIHTREDVCRLAEWGVNAMLVGESLVTAGDVAAKMRELLC